MAYTKTEKRVQFKSDSPRKHSKMGPLPVLMSIFTNPVALTRYLDRFDGLTASFVPIVQNRITSKTRQVVQRQDQNPWTLQTYRVGTVDDTHLGILWGPTNGLLIRYLSREIGSYSTVYYLIKNITRIIHSLDTVKLSGPGEHDKVLPQGSIQGN